MQNPGAVMILIVVGSLLMGLLALFLGSRWAQGSLSCGEILGAGVVALCFLAGFTVKGLFPWNMVLLFVPVVYGLVAWGRTRAEEREAAALREQEFANCQSVLRRDPRNSAAHGRLGQLFQEDGRLQEAMAAYEKSLELDPNQDRVKYQYLHLRERLDLQAGSQVRCPGCRTVQTAQTGICWKCGRVLDEQTLALWRLRRMGAAAKIAVTLFAASSALLALDGLASLLFKEARLFLLMAVWCLPVALVSGIWVGWIFLGIVKAERRAGRAQ